MEEKTTKIWLIDDLETTVATSLVQRGVGSYGVFNYWEVGIFYEKYERLNLDSLRRIPEELRKRRTIRRFSLNRLIIHTTRGFTVDFSVRMNSVLKDFVSRSVGMRCVTSDLYDHSNPWFPSYLG